MKRLLTSLLIGVSILSANFKIGTEYSYINYSKTGLGVRSTAEHKFIVGYENLGFYIKQNVGYEDPDYSEILNPNRGELEQVYVDDDYHFGVQINPVNWLGLYIGETTGSKITVPADYKQPITFDKKNGLDFGVVVSPGITNNLYIGLGIGYNSIVDNSTFGIQIMYIIK
jgi:hypothetical protein